MRWDIGIDLGTRNVRMLTEGAPGALAQAAALAVREGAEAPSALATRPWRSTGASARAWRSVFP